MANTLAGMAFRHTDSVRAELGSAGLDRDRDNRWRRDRDNRWWRSLLKGLLKTRSSRSPLYLLVSSGVTRSAMGSAASVYPPRTRLDRCGLVGWRLVCDRRLHIPALLQPHGSADQGDDHEQHEPRVPPANSG